MASAIVLFNIFQVILYSGLLFLVAGCSLNRPADGEIHFRRNIREYLLSGPVTLLVAALLLGIDIFLAATDLRQPARQNLGLLADLEWAYILYAVIHEDFKHFLGNFLSLLLFGSYVEQKFGKVAYILLLPLTAIAGGYGLTHIVPQLVHFPLETDENLIGFSIVGNAISIMFVYFLVGRFMAEFRSIGYRKLLEFPARVWRQGGPRPRYWSPLAYQAIMLVLAYIIVKDEVALLVNLIGSALFQGVEIDQSATLSDLGHTIGLTLGLVAALGWSGWGVFGRVVRTESE